MSIPVTSQFVGNDCLGLIAMTPYQSTEKPLGSPCIPAILWKIIDDIPIPVHGTPKIMPFAPELDEDLIEVKRVAEPRAYVTLRPKYACRTCEQGVIQAAAPARLIIGGMPTEGALARDDRTAYVESMIQPARVADDVGRKTVALVHVHGQIVGLHRLTCQCLPKTTPRPSSTRLQQCASVKPRNQYLAGDDFGMALAEVASPSLPT